MRTPRRCWPLTLLLLPLALAGCGTGGTGSTTPPVTAPDLSGNWQIQSGGTGSTPPQLGVTLFGALASQGSDVTGTFRFVYLASTASCGFPATTVITVSGSVDAERNLTFTSQPFLNGSILTVHLLIPSLSGAPAVGTIGVTGNSCSVPSGAGFGLEMPSLTGMFAGTLEPGTLSAPGTTGGGPATLTLTQSASPQSDGQFPLTGTMNFTVGTCVTSLPVTGLASGVGVNLQAVSTSTPALPAMTAFAVEDPGTGSVEQAEYFFTPAPCSTAPFSSTQFTGDLLRQ